MSGNFSQTICCYVVCRVTRENGNNGLLAKKAQKMSKINYSRLPGLFFKMISIHENRLKLSF